MRKIITSCLILSVFCFLLSTISFAADCSSGCSLEGNECKQKIEECQKLIEISASATKPHEAQLLEMEKNLVIMDGNIKSLSGQIEKKKVEIAKDTAKVSDSQEKLNLLVRSFYKQTSQSEVGYLLSVAFSGSDFADSAKNIGYRQSLIEKEKKTILGIVANINELMAAQKEMEQTQDWLAAKKISLEKIMAPIRDLVSKAKAYQGQLSQTANQLSARQQQLLAEKTGNFSTSVGDVPDTQDDNSSIDGFRRNAPSGSFAGFSFGAPHRKGMSQYGSLGRAKTGGDVGKAENILSAYYPGTELKKDYRTDINVRVSDYGTSWNIEDYVKRIYEVPNSWGDEGGYEALKAQAVAARSYALAYTNNGSGSICATESCQVAKRDPKGGNWDRAVNDTRGWVLVSGGQPYSAWYAASSGGYNTPGGWDTKCGNQSCWTSDAYEKIAGSPWFYKAWYKPRNGLASRSNAWLSKDESVDIANAAFLYKKDGGTLSHLSQLDKLNGDTWSRDRVRQELNSRGETPFDSIDSVSVTYSTGGYTNKVTINGREIDGADFRQIFNIRAPGEIWLASTLFNIEKK